MIGFWRKHTKSFVIHLVFWPIIAVFIIWGFEKFDRPTGGAAAIVNDHPISVAEYRNALQRMIDFYSQMMQGNFDEAAQKQYRVKEAALRQLINNELVSQQAQKIGIQVTDAEVRKTVTEIPVLQKEGRFSRENYDALLKYYRMTPVQFEENIRKEALLEKTRRLFEKSLKPSKAELEKEESLKSQKMNLEFLRLEKDQFASHATVNEGEAEGFAKDAANQNQLKEYFDLHKSEYAHAEQVHAKHILIKANRGDKAQETAALAKIAKIKDELKKSSFESLAKKYSDDPGSKTKGGELDWFEKGRMVPEFEKTAFEAPIGKVSEPVQTNFGFHLIKVEGKKPAQSTPFEAAKVSIAKKLLAQKKADKAFADADKKMASDPKSAIKELEASSKVKWEETGAFSFGDDRIPKIGEYDEIINAAFSLSPEKPVYPHLIHVGNAAYVLRYKSANGKTAQKTPDLSKMMGAGSEAGRNAYFAWSSKLVEKAKIKPNPQIFSEDAEEANP